MSELRRDPKQELRQAAWLAGGMVVGGAGAIITGVEDHPLRHVAPEAINYFQHSGNLVWSSFVAPVAMKSTYSREMRQGKAWSLRKLGAVAAIFGAVYGGVVNATVDTDIGYKAVGQHLGLNGGETPSIYDLAWGTAYASLVAAGMTAHLRRGALRDVERATKKTLKQMPPEE